MTVKAAPSVGIPPTTDLVGQEFIIHTSEGALRIPCGTIGILSVGDACALEVQALFSSDTPSASRTSYRNEMWSPERTLVIGAENENSVEATVKEYLLGAGLSPLELERSLDEFELRTYENRSVRQLPPIPQRKVELLAACSQRSQPLLLLDPFGIFNGRWRERFAEMTRDFVACSGHAVVALRVSFVPKAWSDAANVSTITVATTKLNMGSPRSAQGCISPDSECGTGDFSTQKLAESWTYHLAMMHRWKTLAERITQWRSAAGIVAASLLVGVVAALGTSVSFDGIPGTRKGKSMYDIEPEHHARAHESKVRSSNREGPRLPVPSSWDSNAEPVPVFQATVSAPAPSHGIPVEADIMLCSGFGELPHWIIAP